MGIQEFFGRKKKETPKRAPDIHGKLFYDGWENDPIIVRSRRARQERSDQIFDQTGYDPYDPLRYEKDMRVINN